MRRLNLPVGDEEAFARLARSRHPLGMSARRATFHLFRETYFDTADGALRANAMVLRLRAEPGGPRSVELLTSRTVNIEGVVEEDVLEVALTDGGLYTALAGRSEVATRVRAVIDPDALRPVVALDFDRETRDLAPGPLRRATHRIVFDQVIGQAADATRAFQCITLTELASGGVSLAALGARCRAEHGIGHDGLDTYARVRAALREAIEPGRGAPEDARLSLVFLRGWDLALRPSPDGMSLPGERGSGEKAARACVEGLGGAGDVDLDLLGFTTAGRSGHGGEVWLHESDAAEPARVPEGLVWMPLTALLERIGGPGLRDPGLIAAMLLLVRSGVGWRVLREASFARPASPSLPAAQRPSHAAPGSEPEDFLDLELSLLDFHLRVLELAEDPAVPLLERFRFLSIAATNLDEFFVVRVAGLKDALARRRPTAGQGLPPRLILDAIAIRARALQARQYRCLERTLLPELAASGVHARRWDELGAESRSALSRRFSEEIFPLLTPLSLSSGPGRRFPRLASLGLGLVAALRRAADGGPELGYVALPAGLPRYLHVPGTRDVVALEDVIAANAHDLFPGADVGAVEPLRVSRRSDVALDEDSTGSLLAAVADEVDARPYKSVVRIEVRPTMPRAIRAHVLKELRAEQPSDPQALTRDDVYEVDGPLDLGLVDELCDSSVARGLYPPLVAADPLDEGRSIFEILAAGDVLVHHPYQDFDATVGRFLREAAADPHVVCIKLTLYRTGRRSPVMDALLSALEAGKEVSVFVELKARFDEESNIAWTQRLTAAGAQVVYGMPGFKIHAKTALVIRVEGGAPRRYVHIGTGNYNAATARFYTDFGLMSTDPDLGADLNDFFNQLTGASGPPKETFRRLLVAPASLGPRLERMIEREVAHARAGGRALIQAKLNGLSDPEVVQALYRASCEGVEVNLIVRSLCTLRPGVPGLSERITVRSVLGRFLEHGRIYCFENGGRREYYIGSADWRARNLRTRVEIATPVDAPQARALLRAVLDAQLADPRAWVLRPDGVFERLRGDGPTSQERFIQAGGFAPPG